MVVSNNPFDEKDLSPEDSFGTVGVWSGRELGKGRVQLSRVQSSPLT